MAHRYSLIFLGNSGSTLRQFHYSRPKLFTFAALLLIILCVIGYSLFDYISLRNNISGRHGLERNLAIQTEEILHQREQIQSFAKEINELKERLVQLDLFEKRIRVMANIDGEENGDGLFGVGGSAPEDLNPEIELTQRHKSLIKEMHQQIGQLDKATDTQQYNFKSLFASLEAQKNLLAHTPAIRPTAGWVTSGFGYRHSPFTGKREFHKGLDIANHKGTKILAAADGMISDAAIEAVGEAGEGMYFSGPDLAYSGDTYDQFLMRYEEKYGKSPISVFHAHAFDATNMVFACIEKVAVQDSDGTLHIGRQAMRDCLFATSDFKGITGSLTCDQYGDCADPKISVSQLQNGEYVRIWP